MLARKSLEIQKVLTNSDLFVYHVYSNSVMLIE